MSSRNQRNTNNDDDSDTDWDSIYDEQEHSDSVHGLDAAANNNDDDDGASRPSKASEAAHERQRSVATATDTGTSQLSSSSSPPSRQQPRQTPPATAASPSWADESTPLIDTDAPPPAYSDIAGNRFEFGQASSRDLRHSRNAGHDDDDDGGEAGRTDYTDPVKRRRGPPRSHKVLKLALFLLSITLIVVLCTTTLRDRHNGGSDDGNGNHRGSDGGSDDNIHDGYGVLPSPPELPSNNTWWKTPLGEDYCRFESYSLTLFFAFPSPPKFSFVEFVEQYGNQVRRVDGVIKITAAPVNQQAAIVVGIWIAATDGYEVETVDVRQTDESLSVKDLTLGSKDQDHHSSSSSGEGPCLAIYVTISVKPDIELSDLEIATSHLNLIVDPSLHTNTNKGLSIREKTEFTTVAGDVSVPYWSSRETIIDVISGSVRGTFALQDLLSIKTRSGGIDVDIDPQSADPKSPSPAELTAESLSGDIDVRFPFSNSTSTTNSHDKDDVLSIPNREYRTRTETRSGSISGTYILGLTSTFKSISGTIAATLLPYYSTSIYNSGLRTETISGTTKINLLAPYFAKTKSGSEEEKDDDEPGVIHRLKSSHTSVSADLNIVYPQEWVGSITSTSMSGRIQIQGKDVKITSQTGRPGRKSVSARKGIDIGEAASEITLFSISGNQDVVIGDLY